MFLYNVRSNVFWMMSYIHISIYTERKIKGQLFCHKWIIIPLNTFAINIFLQLKKIIFFFDGKLGKMEKACMNIVESKMDSH